MNSYQWFTGAIIFFLIEMLVAWVATIQIGNTVMLLSLDMSVVDSNLFNISAIISAVYVLAGIICFALFWFCLVRGASLQFSPLRRALSRKG